MTRASNPGIPEVKTTVAKVAGLYVLLIAVWVLIQSGIPFAPFVAVPIGKDTWLQTLNGWFFIFAAGWLIYLLIARSLDALARATEALRLRDRAIESSSNAIFITDQLAPGRPIVYVNPAFERLTGYSRAEIFGGNVSFLQGAEPGQPELEALRVAQREERACRVVLRSKRRDGSLYWSELYIAPVHNDAKVVSHYFGVQNDITEAKRYQDEIARHANYDGLTELPNRNLLTDRIGGAVTRAQRYNQFAALALLDLDDFRLFNDSAGYAAGDRLLREVSARLASCLRRVDTAARLGGDEFALLLVDQANEQVVLDAIGRVFEAFEAPFQIDAREVFVTASAGVTIIPRDGLEPQALLKNAELAMYRAKERGRNGFQMFAPEMNVRVSERLGLYAKLRRALERGELELHYQPQVSLASNRIVGAEALLRWTNAELGAVPPGKFVPLAEETGLIEPIGDWVLRTACVQAKRWQDAGLAPITIAVNISARQFRQETFLESVREVLSASALSPARLELEVTESVIMQNVQHVIATLQSLKAMGIQLSIDDFGTGYSSLSYLKRFPVDRLKIDQSFVRDIPASADDAAIAQAVINLGHSLELRVIAEGVETAQQMEFLRARGCDESQGYFFGKPLAAAEFEALLRREFAGAAGG